LARTLGDVSIADLGYLNTFAHVAFGTKLTSLDVRHSSAYEAEAEMPNIPAVGGCLLL